MGKVVEYQSDNIEEAKEIQRIFKRYPLGGIPKRYEWLLWLRRLVFQLYMMNKL